MNLSRHGTVSILTPLVHREEAPDYVFMIDVHTLGSQAFTTSQKTSSHNEPQSLKEILESSTYTKVLFDVRKDSDALFSHFEIRMRGVLDLQLMENAVRKGGKRLVDGLAKCIRDDSRLLAAAKRGWEEAKEKGRHLISPDRGDRFEIFNERPLNEDIKVFCEQDVRCLPGLYGYHRAGLEMSHRCLTGKIQLETQMRLDESMTENYQPHGAHKALAPGWGTDTCGCEDEERDCEDQITVRDCGGYEDDMIKNGEY